MTSWAPTARLEGSCGAPLEKSGRVCSSAPFGGSGCIERRPLFLLPGIISAGAPSEAKDRRFDGKKVGLTVVARLGRGPFRPRGVELNWGLLSPRSGSIISQSCGSPISHSSRTRHFAHVVPWKGSGLGPTPNRGRRERRRIPRCRQLGPASEGDGRRPRGRLLNHLVQGVFDDPLSANGEKLRDEVPDQI